MIVFCAGLRSSGSTLQWQMARHLVGDGFILNAGHTLDGYWTSDETVAVKTHQIQDADRVPQSNAKVLTTIRDLRDVACSLMQRGDHGFDRAMNRLRAYVTEHSEWFDLPNPLHVSTYEAFSKDIAGEAERIARFIGLAPDPAVFDEIAEAYSLEQNRKSLKNHITDGAVSKYRDILAPHQVQAIEDEFGDWLARYRYIDPDTEYYMDAKGYLKPEEREWLRGVSEDAAAAFPYPVIVNIGVQYGASIVCLRNGAPRAVLYGIDVDLEPYEGPDCAVLLESRSQAPGPLNRIPEAHLVFVDGSHIGKDVKADADLWGAKVMDRGVIAFHDCRGDVGVHRIVNAAVSEWYAENEGWSEIDAPGSIRAFRRIQ